MSHESGDGVFLQGHPPRLAKACPYGSSEKVFSWLSHMFCSSQWGSVTASPHGHPTADAQLWKTGRRLNG